LNNFALRIVSFLGSGDSRFRIVVATAGASYLGRFGMGIVMLITLPIARHILDPELFGVWMMLSALLGFMAFADLGIGNGVLNKTTQAKASGNVLELRRILVSGYVCTSLVGVAVYLIWLLWMQLSATPTAVAGDIHEANRAEVLQAFHVFAAVLAINIPASLIQRVQLGMQQGYPCWLWRLRPRAYQLDRRCQCSQTLATSDWIPRHDAHSARRLSL
jgi:O-antigen/teichoic acid export membrane protein